MIETGDATTDETVESPDKQLPSDVLATEAPAGTMQTQLAALAADDTGIETIVAQGESGGDGVDIATTAASTEGTDASPSAQVGSGGSGTRPPEGGDVGAADDSNEGRDDKQGEADDVAFEQATTLELTPSLLIKKAEIGNAEVTVALCEYAPDNYKSVAQALKDNECKVLLFELPAETDETRRELEREYTDAIAADADSGRHAAMFEDARDPKNNWTVPGVLDHLQGTGAEVKFIDMSADDPRYQEVVEGTFAAIRTHQQTVANLAPVPEALASMREAVTTLAASAATRDELLEQQCQDIIQGYAQGDEATNIGIVLGAGHYRAVANLDGQATPESDSALAEGALDGLSSFGQAVVTAQTGDRKYASGFAERALLEEYMQFLAIPPAEDSVGAAVNARVATHLINNLNADECQQLLGDLTTDLSDPSEPYSVRYSRAQQTILDRFTPEKSESPATEPAKEEGAAAMGYQDRLQIPEEYRSWDTEYPGYNPPAFTTDWVRTTGVETGMSDPESPTEVDFSTRPSFVEGGYTFDEHDTPLNPMGRQGLAGRGDLAKWGPNQAADPVVVLTNPETGKHKMLLIRRKDTKQWAIPGGMVDPGEHVSKTALRELREETGLDLSHVPGEVIHEGYVDDPRNTDNAWMETTARLFRLLGTVRPRAGDDAFDAHLFDCNSFKELKAAIKQYDEEHGMSVQPLYASHDYIINRAIERL